MQLNPPSLEQIGEEVSDSQFNSNSGETVSAYNTSSGLKPAGRTKHRLAKRSVKAVNGSNRKMNLKDHDDESREKIKITLSTPTQEKSETTLA